jgi:lysozyme
MIDIAFNLGITKLLGFKKALAAMEGGDYYWASTEFNASRWAEQVGYRAEELCDMIETGEYRVIA